MEINSTPKLNTLRSLNDSKTYKTVMWIFWLVSSLQRVVTSQLCLRALNFHIFGWFIVALSRITVVSEPSRKIHQTFERPPSKYILETGFFLYQKPSGVATMLFDLGAWAPPPPPRNFFEVLYKRIKPRKGEWGEFQ